MTTSDSAGAEHQREEAVAYSGSRAEHVSASAEISSRRASPREIDAVGAVAGLRLTGPVWMTVENVVAGLNQAAARPVLRAPLAICLHRWRQR